MKFHHRCLSVACAAVMAGGMGSAVAAVSVANGDFEQDTNLFVTWPGYVANGANPVDIVGWQGEGGRGINPVVPGGPTDAPFRDNGNNATSVAFLQGTASISQQISGFSVGAPYVLSMDFNSRNCCGAFPVATLYFNDTPFASSTDIFGEMGIPPVGAGNDWYHVDIPFDAFAETITFKIGTASFGEGDSTLVVDNISITQVPEPATFGFLLGGLGLLGLRRRRLS